MNLWFKSVSLEDNEDYVVKLCNRFKVNKYNVVYDCGGKLCLVFEFNIDSYKCYIDEWDKVLVLLKRNKANNVKNKDFFHLCKKFPGHDCWYDMFKFITK